jgi:hypothetical protein
VSTIRMTCFIALLGAAPYMAYADSSFGSGGGTSSINYDFQYYMGPCYGTCPTPTFTPLNGGQTQQGFSTTISNYNVPLGAYINSATMTYNDYLSGLSDRQYYDYWNLSCNGCGNIQFGHSPTDYFYSVYSNSWSSGFSASSSGSLDLLSMGFRSSLNNDQALTLYGVNALNPYNCCTSWYGSGGFYYVQDDHLLSNFTESATLSINYTPDLGAVVNAGTDIVANYGDVITLAGSSYHPLGYGYSDGWKFSNGDAAGGPTPTIDLTGPDWAPGSYQLTLNSTDQYGYQTSSTIDLNVLSTPEPAGLLLLGTLVAFLGLRRKLIA